MNSGSCSQVMLSCKLSYSSANTRGAERTRASRVRFSVSTQSHSSFSRSLQFHSKTARLRTYKKNTIVLQFMS